MENQTKTYYSLNNVKKQNKCVSLEATERDQDKQAYREHRIKTILGAMLVFKETRYIYYLRTLEECGTLHDYLSNIKTNQIMNYSIKPIDKPVGDRKYLLDITIKHKFN